MLGMQLLSLQLQQLSTTQPLIVIVAIHHLAAQFIDHQVDGINK